MVIQGKCFNDTIGSEKVKGVEVGLSIGRVKRN